MKILKLRFKNLNSLYGEWEIDFTSSEYVNSGIFAITGATGAGKSTILDAICLALYGSTPRLENINKSSNEIMSRKSGECFSEVTFKVNSGIYACHWGQHRARKSPEGNLLESKHEISDYITGKLLESKKRGVAALVIEKTGMDLKRFTRSILLAQGSFSAFLDATPDERAPILEQITGTEIYSTISKKIHERLRFESDTHNILNAETEGISFLSEDEELSIKSKIKSYKIDEVSLIKQNEELTRNINWKSNITKLEEDILELQQTYNAVLSEIDIFKPSKDLLIKAKKAFEVEAEYAVLLLLKQSQLNETNTLNALSKELPLLNLQLNESESEILKIQKEIINLKEKSSLEQEIIKKVRVIDYDIDKKNIELNNKNNEFLVSKNDLFRMKDSLSIIEKTKKTKISEFTVLEDYLKTNVIDKELISSLSGIQFMFKDFKDRSDSLFFKKAELDEKRKVTQKLKQDIIGIELEYTKNRADLGVIEGLYKSEVLSLEDKLNDKKVREYRDELKYLNRERILLERISSLEEYRHKLIDGDPCPLCGSLTHPYSINEVPVLSEIEVKISNLEVFIESIEDLEKKIQEIELKKTNQLALIANSDKSILSVQFEYGENKKTIERLELELQELNKQYKDSEDLLGKRLLAYNITISQNENPDLIIQELQERLNTWESSSSKFEVIKIELTNINDNIVRLLDDIKKQTEILNLKSEDIKNLTRDIELATSKRNEIYGIKNPDTEELKLIASINRTDDLLQKTRVEHDKLLKKFIETETKSNSIKLTLEKTSMDLKTLGDEFHVKYTNLGFENIDEYKKYRMENDARDSLDKKSQMIESKLSEVITLLQDKEAILKSQINMELTSLDIVTLKSSYNECVLKLNTLSQDLGALKQKIVNNEESKSKLNLKIEQIKKQKIECDNWQKLHNLIGSADGKKYRNFAQGLTFEQMIYCANIELVKMNDRYLLIRDNDNPLELNVIDNYQAGEIRSTKNLSGGESFIVSLALALGLSKMSSNNVKVDSLFLDEGFGTLDEEALELALDTLSSLHQGGKIIGVISHIPTLKQRIFTQINITKNSGGRGIISGPGCKQI